MKLSFVILLALVPVIAQDWLLDFENAKQKAQNENKYILLNFSGSDWCGPCIQMHKEIFDSEVFGQYANEHLILVKADFPRSRKNALSKAQQKKNDLLAESFNNKGIFPLTVLLTAEGKPIKTWEGFPRLSPELFTKQIQSVVNAGN